MAGVTSHVEELPQGKAGIWPNASELNASELPVSTRIMTRMVGLNRMRGSHVMEVEEASPN